MREAKPAWAAVPAAVKRAVAEVLGSPVVRAGRAYGGYGPSATFRLVTADGARAFFKGVYPLPAGSGVVWSLEPEERVFRRLGDVIRPWAPAYVGSVRSHGWHALLLELVAGTPVVPWTRSRLARAARSYAAFHASTLGRPLPRWLPRRQHHEFAGFWTAIERDDEARDRLAGLVGAQAADAGEWLARHARSLAKAERLLRKAREPYALLHFDTRSDNLRLEGPLLRMFDWPFAAAGPAEFDAAAFAQAVGAEATFQPESVIELYERVLPLREAVLVGSVAGISGYFADRAPRAELTGLPRLRSVQRAQLKSSLAWAARLLDLPEPTWLDGVRVSPPGGA